MNALGAHDLVADPVEPHAFRPLCAIAAIARESIAQHGRVCTRMCTECSESASSERSASYRLRSQMIRALEGEVRVDVGDGLAQRRHERGEPAGRHHGRLGTELAHDAPHEAVDHRRLTQQQPRLHARARVRADDLRGRLEVDLREPRRLREQRLGLVSTPGAIAPPRYAPSSAMTSMVVAVPKSTTITGPP